MRISQEEEGSPFVGLDDLVQAQEVWASEFEDGEGHEPGDACKVGLESPNMLW